MSRILGFTSDSIVSPSITIKPILLDSKNNEFLYGWGYGWYPGEEKAAAIIKDATSPDLNNMVEVLKDWKRFFSTIFVCNVRGAAKNLIQKDTQPFSRSYAGRDWIIVHNGTLHHYKKKLPLTNDALFEPMGNTDSEHMFCWLLAKFNSENYRRIADIDHKLLNKWLTDINYCGTLNLILSDGKDMLVYTDMNAYKPIYWARLHPPHRQKVLESKDVMLSLKGTLDQHRTLLLFSTDPLSDDSWHQMKPGQIIIGRRGWIIYDNHYSEDSSRNSLAGSEQQVLYRSPQILTQKNKAQPEPVELSVEHQTLYRYDTPVELSQHILRLKPAQNLHQELLDFNIVISPEGELHEYEDVFGNYIINLIEEEPYTEFMIKARSHVRIIPYRYDKNIISEKYQVIPLIWMPWQRQMMLPYLLPEELPESNLHELSQYAMSFVSLGDNNLHAILADINEAIYRDYQYESGSTSLLTTSYDVFYQHKGVCQDFANLFICLARLLNIPARYRTGYIYTAQNYDNQIQSEASHAWVEVYQPKLGWRGFDPTNGCLVNTDHIQVACGRHYRDATPTSGTIFEGGGKELLDIKVKVERVK